MMEYFPGKKILSAFLEYLLSTNLLQGMKRMQPRTSVNTLTLIQPSLVQEGDRCTRSQAERSAKFGFMNIELNSCIFVQRLVSPIR